MSTQKVVKDRFHQSNLWPNIRWQAARIELNWNVERLLPVE
jgi:hypothetical protein